MPLGYESCARPANPNVLLLGKKQVKQKEQDGTAFIHVRAYRLRNRALKYT